MTIRIGNSILSTSAPIFSDISNRDLSNLSEVGEKHFLNKSQITNCLLEVPQNIKLELADGVLTLKSGSKVIVPNGFESDGVTPKFDYVTVESDVVRTGTIDKTGTSMAYYNRGGLFIVLAVGGNGVENNYFSGTTAPTAGNYMTWYDTTNNVVKATSDGGSTWSTGHSLPFAIVSYNSETANFTSIDQVFNGMGYIGQCTFVDKGVKALFANGRNEDGTLKNIEKVTTTINISNIQNQISILSRFDGNNLWGYGVNAYYIQDSKPAITGQYAIWYSPLENYSYLTSDGGVTWDKHLSIVGKLTKTDATGNISNMSTFKPFRAVDYNDYTKDLDTKADKTVVDEKADKTDLNTKVNKTGDTMTGNLSIVTTNGLGVSFYNDTIDLTTTPESNKYAGFLIGDKNKTRIGELECAHYTDGRLTTSINTMFTKSDGTRAYCAITTGFDKAGNAFTTAPTPATGDNSTKIATTAYCVNMRCTTKATTTSSASTTRPAWVVQNYVNGLSWYRVWSDGWIEQGGAVSRNANDMTITLLKTMSNTNYTILRSEVGQTKAQYDSVIHTIATSSFKVYCAMTTSEKTSIKWYACGY